MLQNIILESKAVSEYQVLKLHKYYLSMIIIGNKSVSLQQKTGKNASFTHLYTENKYGKSWLHLSGRSIRIHWV